MIRSSDLEIEVEQQGDRVLITIRGELDLATVAQLERRTASALELGPLQLVVDLSSVGFIDSSGLRFFVGLAARAARDGFSLSLLRPREPALTVFRISGAEENLPFVDDQLADPEAPR